jgi:hypothetical protein
MAGTPLAVGVIVLLAAAVQSATGFGYAILAAPLLSTVVGATHTACTFPAPGPGERLTASHG